MEKNTGSETKKMNGSGGEGSKQQSHQDYLEKADKARSERLSAGSSSTK
ncbi:unnamed protein product [Withania somnifera]